MGGFLKGLIKSTVGGVLGAVGIKEERKKEPAPAPQSMEARKRGGASERVRDPSIGGITDSRTLGNTAFSSTTLAGDIDPNKVT